MPEPAEPAGAKPMDRLLALMARLRDPQHGCPWDVAQSFATIAPYTVEEAYEVADAIERGSLPDLKVELGDLLFQVVFHSRMAEEQGAFAFADVAQAIIEKMERRHPHVFGDAAARDASTQSIAWEVQKAAERAAKGPAAAGVLADVPAGLPALTRAVKLTRRAARVGFDWPDLNQVMAKLAEETAELQAEIDAGDAAKAREELGDLLFVVANLARKLEVDPEDALRAANAKFARRFGHIEAGLAAVGRVPEQSNLAEMDALWNAAKAEERAPALQIRPADLADAQVQALLRHHHAHSRANSPEGLAYVLDLSELEAPGIDVWAAWRGGDLAGLAALRRLEAGHGELKSMRTHPDHLRSGVGAALLERVIEAARAADLRTLSLETGSGPAYDAAYALYRKRGFEPCAAFGDYRESSFNRFLTMRL